MELPQTNRGNKYVLVFQDYLTKWPLAIPMPDQKTHRIAELLVTEVIPLFGVPEALLSDRGTNLLSHLMQDICKLLGIQKLNTIAHHPESHGRKVQSNPKDDVMQTHHKIRLSVGGVHCRSSVGVPKCAPRHHRGETLLSVTGSLLPDPY